MRGRFNLIPILADILIDTEKEKVVRMCVATFRVRPGKRRGCLPALRVTVDGFELICIVI